MPLRHQRGPFGPPLVINAHVETTFWGHLDSIAQVFYLPELGGVLRAKKGAYPHRQPFRGTPDAIVKRHDKRYVRPYPTVRHAVLKALVASFGKTARWQ